MKAKRKPIPNGTQGWAAPTSSQQSRTIPFDEYHSNLISIVKAIHTANGEYLSIVKEYLRWRNWSSFKNPFSFGQQSGRFTQDDLRVLEGVLQTQPPVSGFVTQPSGSRLAVPQLLDLLRDTSYVGIWERAAENMAFLKSHPKHQTKNHQEKGRKRAENLKGCRVALETGFSNVKKELRVQGLGSVCDGILMKLDMLRKYEEAYPIPSERRIDLWFKFQTPTLSFFNTVFLLASLIPLCMAWNKSTDVPGSTEDPDFWTLIFSAINQSQSLVSTLYTINRQSEGHHVAWICAIWLTAGGIVCAYVGIPMYLFLPTKWSVLISAGGAISQLGVILEIAWMTDHSKLKKL
ncbi:hypothetical protein F4776DRAFT_663543 [Hypoxylon sp. NC0597]|nr:hypothetical protein F4776DRAFT_663543 [Hypoxylon sp. NC0597]